MTKFPLFKNLELSDKADVERITSKYKSYSDFNFLSLWSWDTQQHRQISILNNNLVVRFTDYLTGNLIFSIIGDTEINNAVEQVITYSKEVNGIDTLKYVPLVVVEHLDSSHFKIIEDEDNFDHIISTEALTTYAGNKLKNKRQLARKITELGARVTVSSCNPADESIHVNIFELLQKWKKNKENRGHFVDLYEEQLAILRILKAAQSDVGVLLTCIFLDETIAGFSIDEIVSADMALSHYFKTDDSVVGLSEYLNQQTARLLLARGAKFWNWEQDLGIQSLRKMKSSYRPVDELKKFKVKMK